MSAGRSGHAALARGAARGLPRRRRRIQRGAARHAGAAAAPLRWPPYLRLTSSRAVLEPFVDVILEMNWSSGRLVREYTMLFDPPVTRTAQAAPAAAPAAVAPVISAAPAPAPRAWHDAAHRHRHPHGADAVACTVCGGASPGACACADSGCRTASDAGRAAAGRRAGIRSRPDSPHRQAPRQTTTGSAPATRSAASPQRIPRSDVSLDQMLVALFRANPDAFMGDNMNRLKAGAVLTCLRPTVPRQTVDPAAREVIRRPECRLRGLPAATGLGRGHRQDRPAEPPGQGQRAGVGAGQQAGGGRRRPTS